MDTLDIEGWYQVEGQNDPVRINEMKFHVSGDCQLEMERAEEALHDSVESERFVDVPLDTLELTTKPDCGPLSDCQFRVYINSSDHRGHFHLVGHRASDHALVYSNAVMVDQVRAG